MKCEPMKYFLFQTQAHVLPLPENCAWLLAIILLITDFVFVLFYNQALTGWCCFVKGNHLLNCQIQLSF